MPEGNEGTDDAAIRARSIWSGTISFGLVSIPVRLFPANRSSGVSLRMLDEDGTPLSRRYYEPESGREVARDDIVRGYEVEKDEFIVVTEEELEALEPEKTRDIDLRQFVDVAALDPVFFERAYFLAPDGESTKAYRLLAAVMEERGRAGIATFVMRTKEYLIAILSENGILRAETLRFADEIRSVEAIALPERPKVPAARKKAMRAVIRDRSEEELDRMELEDRYAQRVRTLVDRKQEEGAVRTAPSAARDAEPESDVIDLMEVLKRSLQGGGEAEEEDRESADSARSPRRAPRRDAGDASPEELRELTRAELYERAKALEISGRSSMRKDQLVEAIRKSA